MTEASLFIISYVPLLRGTAGEYIKLSAGKTEDQLRPLLDKVYKADAGKAHGCAWSLHNNGFDLMFVIDNAKEVHDHLIEWAEGVPQRWFDLCIDEVEDQYCVALLPKWEMSFERYREAYHLTTGHKLSRNTKAILLAKPITFISDPRPATFNAIKDKISPRVVVGLVDKADITPAGIEDDKVYSLGSFKVHRNTKYDYFKGIIDGAEV